MKKTLLALSFLMGLGLQGHAQFQAQNSTIAADYQFSTIQTLDANTVWGLAGTVVGTTLNANTYVRTTNGGTTWTSGIVAPSGFAGYQVGGLYATSATTAFAAMYNTSTSDGLLARTTNGGTTWTAVTTPGAATSATAQFGSPRGFANWVHFFDAQNGVAQGDPNVTSSSTTLFFEIYTTSNGGTTWTRVPRTSTGSNLTSNANEYGVVSQYYAVGNTIWFTTLYDNGGGTPITTPSRVFKSTDRGITWTSASTNIPTAVSGVAFADDALHGLVWNGSDLSRTNNGGTTWATQPYSTPFHRYDVSGVRGSNSFISVGLDARVTTPMANTEFGVSISNDFGATWRDIATGTSYTAVSFSSPTVGYVGGFATAMTGGGAVAKYTGGSVLSNRNAELQKALAVYPNPSSNGIFTVQLASSLKSGASVRVVDVVGRQVVAQQLNATAIAAKSTTVDLSKEKAGIYTLELRTEAGVAQQKLVVE